VRSCARVAYICRTSEISNIQPSLAQGTRRCILDMRDKCILVLFDDVISELKLRGLVFQLIDSKSFYIWVLGHRYICTVCGLPSFDGVGVWCDRLTSADEVLAPEEEEYAWFGFESPNWGVSSIGPRNRNRAKTTGKIATLVAIHCKHSHLTTNRINSVIRPLSVGSRANRLDFGPVAPEKLGV
jgi:hypothetical protein